MSQNNQNAVIAKLNEILRHEWTGVAQYAHFGFVVCGLWREVYSKMFHDSAKESFGHAQAIGSKIASLGGVPTIERNAVKLTNDLQEMLKHSLDFESTAVRHYNEAIQLAEGDRALCVFLEDILVEEQDGVDAISKILREHVAAAGTVAASKAG